MTLRGPAASLTGRQGATAPSQGIAPSNRRSEGARRRSARRADRPPLRANADSAAEGGGPRAAGNAYSKVYPGKATWEGTFGVDTGDEGARTPGPGGGPSSHGVVPPWEVVGQLNESNLVWNDHLREGLLKAVVTQKLGIEGAELDGRINELRRLIPEMAAKLPRMDAQLVASLLEDTSKVARRLVQMKTVFPAANVSQLATRCPALLITAEENMEDMQAKAQTLRGALPGVNIDKLVSQHPVEVLNVESFLEAITEARRLVPSLDIPFTLENNPTQIFSFQRGSAMIPYDDVKELW